jgi:hypothetical protein
MVLNGINYTEKHLTDEEAAVINAMRRGAKVDVKFYESTYETASAHSVSLAGKLPHRTWVDLTHSESPFIAYEMRNEKYGASVTITHIIRTKKAAE